MQDHPTHQDGAAYRNLALELILDFIIMYFVMFSNMDKLSHYHTSITRLYMAILMVAPMAAVMLLMMGKMYQDKKKCLRTRS